MFSVCIGSGQNEADWGIEPTEDDHDDDSDAAATSFAPALSSTVRSRLSAKSLKPLRLSQAGSGQRARFYELFSRAVDSRLGRSENSRFLERFRYIIVASQLLNGHVNVSHYDRKPDTDQLFSEEDPTTIFGQPLSKGRHYWVGSGGFVLVTSLVLSWVFRGTSGKGFSKARAICALLLSLMVAVFLFTQARRKWLRSLRKKSVEYAVMFVENSQTFDILASNAVTLIQEVELVSRGYRLSTPLPPISRLERDTQTRRCARLRKSVLGALEQAIPPHSCACEALRNLVQEEDLERYFDIYDIQMADIEDAENGINIEEFEDMESLKALKALLHRLHTIRRVFLCSLMAIEADGRHADYSKWSMVVEQLKVLGNTTAELAGELKRISTEEEQFFVPPTPKVPISPENEKYRGQLRKLNSLSQALRGLQAKMHVLREESDRTLQESSDLSDFGKDLLSHYDSIGADLRGLVDEWENARASLVMSVDRRDRANSNSPRSSKSPESLAGTTLVGNTPRNSGLFNKEGGWADAAGLGLLASPREEKNPSEEDSGTEEVYEAVAEPRPKSLLTREERIKKVQDERMKAAENRKNAEAGLALQRELQAVLINLPPTRRRYTGRNFSR
ncbi:Mysoin-binding motif of peroxisomes-domain-containing protein [Geopyxis carbonaria]|nr:Mysoin-binding motif of peroxisomes-domain-containing protein [Geopyxis carbonaria]